MLSHLIESRSGQTIIGDASEYLKLLANKYRRVKAGVAVTDQSALNHSAVWAGLDFISSTLAMLPLNLYARDERGNRVKQDDELSRLVGQAPNPRQTSFFWRQITQAQAVLYGGGCSWVERDRRGIPRALWPLPPIGKGTRIGLVDGTMIFQSTLDGESVSFPAIDVLHIPGFSLNGVHGLPLLEYGAQVIGHGLAAQEFSAAFFGQGLTPRFVVTHPGDVGPKGRMKISDDLDETYGGLRGSHRALVLDEGMKVHTLTIEPEKAQMLETRRDNRVEIASMMRIPPPLIGIWDRATFNNAEQMDLFVVKYTLGSWIKRWENELNTKLLTAQQIQQGWFFKFNTNALLRGDITARANFYKTMLQGPMSINEIRALEDLPTIPGFDRPFIPLNMGVVTEDGQIAAADKAGAEPGNQGNDNEQETEDEGKDDAE